MAKQRTGKEVPVFQSLEQEKEYWEARGPLAEGRKGRVYRPKSGQKRSSFLAVRLTGEELTRLRDVAAKQGLGPSTYSRLQITRSISSPAAAPVTTSDELMNKLLSYVSKTDKDKLTSLVKETAGEESYGNPASPLTLVFDSKRDWEEHRLLFLTCLLGLLGVRIVASNVGRVSESVVRP